MLLYVPTGHGAGTVLPLRQYDLAGHDIGLWLPYGQYDPAGQGAMILELNKQ